jgi:hypothetical protein
MKYKSVLVFSLLPLASCTDLLGGGDEKRIAGFYILEGVDGVLLPAPLVPEQGCNRTVRKVGYLSLSGRGPDVAPMYDWTIYVDAECEPVPAGVFQGADDVGGWRLNSTQLSFSSMIDKGRYGAVVEETPGNSPVVTLVFLGDSYRFRRIDDPTSVVFVQFRDQFGQPVAWVPLHFALPYGLEGGGTAPESGWFGTSGHVGEWQISFTPPEGYEVPASQSNPISVTVVEGPAIWVYVTLTKLPVAVQ